ncbi:MAG: site-specific integrase [Chitinophagaceae bacterium]
MKPTNFSKYITDYLSRYLPGERGARTNTITAYRDTFVLLISFLESDKKIKIEKLTLEKINKQTILDFLKWLQDKRKCSNSTRNARLAAIHSFYTFLQGEALEYLEECQKILSIKFKRQSKETMTYLTVDGIRLLLAQPDVTTRNGRRDLTLLSLMYDSGGRVQEIIDLTPSMLRLGNPPTVKIIGKGNKARLVPLLDAQIEHLKHYLTEHRLNDASANAYPLFFNSRKEKLTRAGVNHILRKYCNAAKCENASLIPNKISCHSLRHSKAMHLLQAGVNLVYIRDILGHVSIQTTEIYARADSKQKREALEAAYINIIPAQANEATWEKDSKLREWLKNFAK